MDKISELLTRGVANSIPGKNELEKVLKSGRKLNVYLGIDPTATKIHLGHAMPLRKLQEFAELGHHVTFLIGDFTALIGDTSDKDSERPALTKDEVEENFQTYKSQAEKILDFSKVEVKKNSQWLEKLSFEEIIKLTQNFSVGDFVGRELIKKRLSENKRVGLHELLYPVMQGYDSYFMDTDVQIGGADQVFNMQAGRTLQKNLRKKGGFVLCTDYLMGTDGRKMSKSWGNAIWLTDEPFEMYRKVMAINDDQIRNYFILATNSRNIPTHEDEVKDNPLEWKKKLAKTIVIELHSKEAAEKAQEEFEKVVQKGDISGLPKTNLSWPASSGASISQVMAKDLGIFDSVSEAKRSIIQGGTTAAGNILTNPNADATEILIGPETEIIVGKKKVYNIKVKK